MNNNNLRAAQLYFEKQIPVVTNSRKELHSLRKSFVDYYSVSRIKSMSIERYALGNPRSEKGFDFCYTLERQLDGLGRILGAQSSKFGVYYGKTKSDPILKYRFTKRFGNTYQEAFGNIKKAIIQLIEMGVSQDIEGIIANPISPMFKGKILSTYFPERYLNIFSDEHLEYYLTQLNIDTRKLIYSDPFLKREALTYFKNHDDVMKHWSLDLFAYFLYSIYPGSPPKEDQPSTSDHLKEFRGPSFPVDPTPVFIDLEIADTVKDESKSKHGSAKRNPDYDKENKANKILGDRGEHLVLQMEKDRLKHLPKLAKKIKPADFDYQGYDILSYEEDGTPRYIEVKATRSKTGQANFFLSSNELEKSSELQNYWIYIVFDILSNSPNVWRIPNPLHPENPLIKKVPITYRVVINPKKL
jgi:hypothetical protein